MNLTTYKNMLQTYKPLIKNNTSLTPLQVQFRENLSDLHLLTPPSL